jgi:hypothetical protein
MLVATQISWDKANYLWSDFAFGNTYAQYLLETYGITVEATGREIWNHVLSIEVIVVPIFPGGAGDDNLAISGRKKKVKNKIKLIFIMGDVRKDEVKEVNDTISAKLVSDIQNKIEEQLQTKISLSDVQIIKG